MRLIEKKKERLYICGVPILSERVKGNRLQYRFLGMPFYSKTSRIASLISRVKEMASFDSRALDAEIADYFADIPVLSCAESTDPNRVAILTTKLRDRGGGDMRMMSDIAKLLSPERTVRFYATDLPRSKKAGRRLYFQFSREYSVFGTSTYPSAIKDEVKELVDDIVRFNPKVILCFIRPTDVWGAGILAVLKRATNIKVVYYAHAGERPNIGVSFGDLLPQALLPMTRLCAVERHANRCLTSASVLTSGAKDNAHVYTDAEKAAVRTEFGIKSGCLFSLSGGEATKFFDSCSESEYFRTIRRLLERNSDVQHMVLADFSQKQLKVIEEIFSDSDVRNRLLLHSRTNRYEELFAAADVFLDSFPMSGAYTMLDLMRLGVPYVVKINASDPTRSFQDYQDPNYPYMFADANDYLMGAERLLRDVSERKLAIDMNRRHYEKTFAAKPCRDILNKIIDNADDFSRIIEPYNQDSE